MSEIKVNLLTRIASHFADGLHLKSMHRLLFLSAWPFVRGTVQRKGRFFVWSDSHSPISDMRSGCTRAHHTLK